MFDGVGVMTTEGLTALVDSLARVETDVTDGERIDQLAALERVKAAVAAAQVRVTASFVESQEQVSAGWRARAQECSDGGDFDGWRVARDAGDLASWQTQCELGADTGPSRSSRSMPRSSARARAVFRSGVAAQVALAQGLSPTRGSQQVRVALTLTTAMPHVMACLEQGLLSEWRASIVVRECAVLTDEQRGEVDRDLADTLGEADRSAR
ncbi:MAG: nuclease [Humibacillus sp.]|nr:nuclease [Humibacillus sp.]